MTKKSIISFVLDESGSMQNVVDDTIGGFNSYLSSLITELEGDDVTFSLIKFDSNGVRPLCESAPLHLVPQLNKHNYKPNGGTPLIDAIAKTIKATEQLKREHPNAVVTVVVQTDGQENGSREFTNSQLKQMIEEKQGQGWLFMFLGADIDAFSQASAFGIHAGNTASYSKAATVGTFAAVARGTVAYSKTADLQNASFTTGERKMMSGE